MSHFLSLSKTSFIGDSHKEGNLVSFVSPTVTLDVLSFCFLVTPASLAGSHKGQSHFCVSTVRLAVLSSCFLETPASLAGLAGWPRWLGSHKRLESLWCVVRSHGYTSCLPCVFSCYMCTSECTAGTSPYSLGHLSSQSSHKIDWYE